MKGSGFVILMGGRRSRGSGLFEGGGGRKQRLLLPIGIYFRGQKGL